MISYKLLTPGPLTTTETVKQEMMTDHCTWDDDYKQITQEIRKGLLKLAHVSEDEYTAVLMQGSGTFGVESVLTSVVGDGDELLICANGAYGERMADIADHAGIRYHVYNEHYNKVPNAQKIAELLDAELLDAELLSAEVLLSVVLPLFAEEVLSLEFPPQPTSRVVAIAAHISTLTTFLFM